MRQCRELLLGVFGVLAVLYAMHWYDGWYVGTPNDEWYKAVYERGERYVYEPVAGGGWNLVRVPG